MKYLTILDFMVKDLNLKGNDLLVYAVIYGFSQDEETKFTGSYQYIADICNISKRTAMNIVANLVDKGLIIKEESIINSVKCNRYSTQCKTFTPSEKFSLPLTKETTPLNNICNIYNNPPNKERDNNINNNILSNNLSNSVNNSICKDNICNNSISNICISKSARFAQPSLDDVKNYIKEKGYHFLAEDFINHYESVGWFIGKNKMKDWKAACRTWESNYKKRNNIEDSKEEEIHYGTKI